MGVLKKLKDIFYDEIVDDEEIAKEEQPVEPTIKKITKDPIINEPKEQPVKEKEVFIPRERVVEEKIVRPVREEPKEEKQEITERELYQSKQTFKFPVVEDDDFKPTPRKTRSGSTNIMDIERRNREIKRREEPKEEKRKSFKPSPVISPIYGIIDKDYDRNEFIKEEKRTSPDYDSIRKKAYGVNDRVKEEANKVLLSVNEIEEELNRAKRRTNIEEVLEQKEDMTVGEAEIINESLEKEDIINDDKTLEHDLFNLIDSMYEEEDKE